MTSRDTWKPAWLAPPAEPVAEAPVEEPVEEPQELQESFPEVEPVAVEVPTVAEPRAAASTRRRIYSTTWNTWTEHHDGRAYRVIQAAGEFVPSPWRFDDDHEPLPGVCRCGCSEHRDTSIRDGESIRRDCANCGRFVGFPSWYETNATA